MNRDVGDAGIIRHAGWSDGRGVNFHVDGHPLKSSRPVGRDADLALSGDDRRKINPGESINENWIRGAVVPGHVSDSVLSAPEGLIFTIFVEPVVRNRVSVAVKHEGRSCTDGSWNGQLVAEADAHELGCAGPATAIEERLVQPNVRTDRVLANG